MPRHRKSRPRWFWLALLSLSLSLAGTGLSFAALVLLSTPHSPPPRLPGHHATLPAAPPRLPAEPRPGHARPPAEVHVVVPGDTLWGIAARDCRDPLAWPALYAANRAVIGLDPGLIFPGQRLVLACAYHRPKAKEGRRP